MSCLNACAVNSGGLILAPLNSQTIRWESRLGCEMWTDRVRECVLSKAIDAVF